MASRVPLFFGFSGINNIVMPTRIGMDKNAFAGIETAKNVFVTAGGLLETVSDSTVSVSGKFHSLYEHRGSFYCVKDGDTTSSIYLCSANGDDLTFITVVTNLTKGLRVSFTPFGDFVYYSNGVDNGRISGTTRSSWPKQKNNRLVNLVDFVPGTQLDFISSRILSIHNDEISFTESFLPGLIDGAKNVRRLNSRATMIKSVGTGSFVSDEKSVYFMRGINPNDSKLEKVLEYPAIEYGVYPKLVDPSFFGFSTRHPAALFNTADGLCIGLESGEAYNLTEKRYRQYFDCDAITVFDDSLVVSCNGTSGTFTQCVNEELGNKAVTEWDGGFSSLVTLGTDTVIGANEDGLSFVFGQSETVVSGLQMLDNLEMLDTLEMV